MNESDVIDVVQQLEEEWSARVGFYAKRLSDGRERGHRAGVDRLFEVIDELGLRNTGDRNAAAGCLLMAKSTPRDLATIMENIARPRCVSQATCDAILDAPAEDTLHPQTLRRKPKSKAKRKGKWR